MSHTNGTYISQQVNSLRPRQMDAISQMTFSNAFSWMKMSEFRLKFHWSLFPRVQLTIFQHWLRWWLGAVQATSHYLNQWVLVYQCIYASLGINELTTYRGCLYVIWTYIIFNDVVLSPRVNAKNYVHNSHFVVYCCGMVPVNFIYIHVILYTYMSFMYIPWTMHMGVLCLVMVIFSVPVDSLHL